MATAIADAAAARRAYLDETGGRYVHVIAAGGIHTSADVAKAIACGADAVMLGEPLTWSQTAPAGGWYWPTSTAHPVVPRGFAAPCGPADVPLGQLLLGPAAGADGRTNLFGALAPRDGEGRLLRSEVVPEGRVVRPDVSLRRPRSTRAGTRIRWWHPEPPAAVRRYSPHRVTYKRRAAGKRWRGGEREIGRGSGGHRELRTRRRAATARAPGRFAWHRRAQRRPAGTDRRPVRGRNSRRRRGSRR